MSKINRVKTFFKKPQLWLGVLLIAGLILSGCLGGQSAARGWSGVTVSGGNLYLGSMDGRVVAINTADGSLAWSVPLQQPASGGGAFGCGGPTTVAVVFYSTPAVDGDIVYISGYNGKLYRINAITRDSKEVYLQKDEKTAPGQLIGGPVVAQDKVYAGSSDSGVYAVDALSLEKRWRQPTGDKIWSTPAISGDILYITSFDKKLYALNASDGSRRWAFDTSGAIVASPVVEGGAVYFGSLDKYFYALNEANGQLKWRFQANNWFWSKPVVHNGVVYAANLDGNVYALDAATGNKLVEFSLGAPASAAPVLVDSTVIVVTETGIVYSLDTGTREQKKLVELAEKVYSSPAASDGKVYIHTNSDKLLEIDARSGAKREISIK